MSDAKHIMWIFVAALVGFFSSFIFGDLLTLPLDLYYLIYFGIITGFFVIYIRLTKLDVKLWLSRRLIWGIVLGIVFAIVMTMNVLSRPETAKLRGIELMWAIFWRGLIYGVVDGLLLSVFPWIVTWRAFNAEEKPLLKKIGIALLAWIFILVMTTAYHLGYSDFHSPKVIQANIGNSIISMPTLVSANPIGAPIAHATLYTSAVIHSLETDLFCPITGDRNPP